MMMTEPTNCEIMCINSPNPKLSAIVTEKRLGKIQLVMHGWFNCCIPSDKRDIELVRKKEKDEIQISHVFFFSIVEYKLN